MVKLYRHFDKDGNLLYVGVALNAVSRLRHPKVRSSWFDDITLITIETYRTREEALIAETAAIAGEKPTFNVAWNFPHIPEGNCTFRDFMHSIRWRCHRARVQSFVQILIGRPARPQAMRNGAGSIRSNCSFNSQPPMKTSAFLP
jgi:hypothetical protein